MRQNMLAAISVAPVARSTGTATTYTMTYAATPGTPMPRMVDITMTIRPPRNSCPSPTTLRIRLPKLRPRLVMLTEPMITPMMMQLTPTPMALRLPSTVAFRMVEGFMRVSLRSQETGIVTKIAAMAANSGV